MKGKKKQRRMSRKGSGGLWVGGIVPAPAHITGEGAPYRPNIILWLELPEEFITFMHLEDPGEPDFSFGESLSSAMKTPLVGPPRKPARIRVADRALADAAQSVLPEASVTIAPTPELQRTIDMMAKDMLPEEDTDFSYFEDGRVAKESVAAFFQAAQTLYRGAPWKHAASSQVLRVDIPEMGIRAACLSVIGNADDNKGFLLFESLTDFDSFLELADDPESEPPGVRLLTLEFSRTADLPSSMVKEAMRHGWPVASPESYPRIYSVDPDATIRPLTEREYCIIAMISTSLTAFIVKHGHLFEIEDITPVCESFFNNENMEVRFTVPAWEGHLFEANAGDDDYEGTEDYEYDAGDGDVLDVADKSDLAAMHDFDKRLLGRILKVSSQHPDKKWMKALPASDSQREIDLSLIVIWAMYTLPAKGGTFAARFIDDRKNMLSDTARDWLVAQGRSWLSIWEVLEIEAGKRMKLRDLLTGEERDVIEKSATKILIVNRAILARIVDWQDFSLMCGCHVNPLPPLVVDDIVQAVRKKLRRKNNVSPEALRNEKIGRYMIECWLEAVANGEIASKTPPRMQNTGRDERGEIPPEEIAQLIRTHKKKHYEAWVDESLPALNGKTPRDMARTKSGKSRVALLIKDMESGEGNLSPEERFDFNILRKRLGIRE